MKSEEEISKMLDGIWLPVTTKDFERISVFDTGRNYGWKAALEWVLEYWGD